MRLVINSLETKRCNIKAGAQFANGNAQAKRFRSWYFFCEY
jgi:hypothetical protein